MMPSSAGRTLRHMRRGGLLFRTGAICAIEIEADKEPKHMNKTNLKPLAWGLLGAGVAVMGTAGALDLPSWLRHSTTNTVTTPGAGGTSAAIAAAATGQQVAPTPVTPPLPALPPGTAPNYRAIVQEFGPSVVHVSVAGTHKQTA